MKAMLLNFNSFRPTLEHFPKLRYICDLMEQEFLDDFELTDKNSSDCTDIDNSKPSCDVTVQQELQKFMDLQEARLKKDFKCRQCRNCDDCRWGAGHERLRLKQEAEQQLFKESITIDHEAGIAVAKLPFIVPPESNLSSNSGRALGMLNNVIRKYCKDQNMRENILAPWRTMIDDGHLMFLDELSDMQ